MRRANFERYATHHEDLESAQIDWWQVIPTATPATAIAQCLAYGTPTYLFRQAAERGHSEGYLTADERNHLAEALENRNDR